MARNHEGAATLSRRITPISRRAGVLGIALAVGVVALGGALLQGAVDDGSAAVPAASGVAILPSASSAASSDLGSASPASPTPTPVPTPVLVAAPLDGVPVSPAAARQHVIAVMIDDHSEARPQSGFSDASVVWQAPAEGGIPRYMLMFQERTPKAVGPVRSARLYYVGWASEWRAAFVHVGGSPGALQTLRTKGQGQLVYNADEYAWGSYFWRVTNRYAPHNLYTDGKHLRSLAARVNATAPPGKAAWLFSPDSPLEKRPVGGRIEVGYLGNTIVYRYDRASNTYRRFVKSTVRHVDPSTKKQVAPKNVVIMRMVFGALNDGHPEKQRLDARYVGSGTAWIATNGRTIKGTWRKPSITAPTRFYDAAGQPVHLTIGQTFVQVMKTTDVVRIKDGTVPATTSPGATPTTSPTPTAWIAWGPTAI
jgi:hypothetical protein